MESAGIVFQQTLTMAIYMAAGFVLFKTGKITKEGSKSLANLLVWLVIPTVIVDSFCVQFSGEKLQLLGISALVGAAVLALAVMMARLIFPKRPIDNFAAAFSNCGFMGIPLVRAGFGDEAVFLLVGLIVMLNFMQWTYGANLLRGGKSQERRSLKGLVLNPVAIGAFLGLILFFTGLGVRLPSFARGAIGGISALNSPIAMLVLGIYMAQSKWKDTFLAPGLYWLSAVRLVVIPAATLGLLMLIPADSTLKTVLLIAASAPVGANVAVYAQIYDADYQYACRTVALSTVLSILTLPLVTAGARLFL